jgi:uncharacterized protein YhaN
MRLARLDLIRYGKFTDKALEFGPRPAAGPDLHIVYGANEAGKSTLFAGLLDLLYGIPQQSPYGFLHGYEVMRVGGVITAEGRDRTFIRTKRQPTLLDREERGLPETAMAGLLGGFSRDDYRLMFSLDGDTLKKGGRDILASKGDLGQLLFSASAGLADLSEKLAMIEQELDKFQKPGGRSGRLADLRRDAEALKKQREEADVSAGAYAGLEEAVRMAAAADAAAGTAYRAAAERDARITVLLEALRLADEHRALAAEEAAAAERAEVFKPILADAASMDALGAQAGVYRKALEDLPNRRTECDAAEAMVRDLLVHLRRPDERHPRKLLLDAAQTVGLRDLIVRKGPLDARREAARDAAAAAARMMAESEAALAGSSGVPDVELGRVRAALDALRGENLARRRKDAEAAATAARRALGDALEALSPWRGEAANLAALDAPQAADVTAAGAEIASSAAVEESRRQAHERAQAAFARLQAELSALGEAGVLRDGAEHGAIRAAREASWAAHRKALDGKTADAFEAALRRDDAAMESRLTQAELIARAAQLRVSVAAAEADLKQAAHALESAAEKATAARARLAGMVAAVSHALNPALSAEALNGWLKRREDALRFRAALRDAERDADDARVQEEGLRGGLLKALSAAGAAMADDAATAALAAVADELLRSADAATALRSAAERAAREAADRRAALEVAQAEVAGWDAAWRDALAACWLGELEPAPGPAIVAEILETLVRLQGALDTRAERLDRLRKIEQDIAAFDERATALAARFDIDAGGDPMAVVRTVLERIGAARQAVEARERLSGKRADAQRDLLQRLKAGLLAEAEAMLADVDASALTAEQSDLALTLPLLDKQRVESGAALLTARRALDAVGGDAGAARLAGERANLLLEMGEEASRHLARRLGVMAMRQALRRYRDQHRSSMLEAASAAFAVMTREAYTGLRAQADGGTEKLVAIMAEGGSREADQLSTGTQYQLYLALRVAGYAEVARERTPLPFVCDDIFETFDDLRAEEAMKLLSVMAESGQVICLTHHRHLCAIAREVVPGARLLEL